MQFILSLCFLVLLSSSTLLPFTTCLKLQENDMDSSYEQQRSAQPMDYSNLQEGGEQFSKEGASKAADADELKFKPHLQMGDRIDMPVILKAMRGSLHLGNRARIPSSLHHHSARANSFWKNYNSRARDFGIDMKNKRYVGVEVTDYVQPKNEGDIGEDGQDAGEEGGRHRKVRLLGSG